MKYKLNKKEYIYIYIKYKLNKIKLINKQASKKIELTFLLMIH